MIVVDAQKKTAMFSKEWERSGMKPRLTKKFECTFVIDRYLSTKHYFEMGCGEGSKAVPKQFSTQSRAPICAHKLCTMLRMGRA